MQEIPIRTNGVAAVVVRDCRDDRKFLLLRRTRPPVGAWTYVAGTIESREKAPEAAVREVREESGLGVTSLYSADLCEQFYQIGLDAIWIAPVFVAFVNDGVGVVLNAEHDQYRWCSILEAVALLTFPGTRTIVEKINKEFLQAEPSPFLRIF